MGGDSRVPLVTLAVDTSILTVTVQQEGLARAGSESLIARLAASRVGAVGELTAKEFQLLEFFVTRPGRALTRDDILNHVWGHSVVVTPRSIDRCVATLRAKIEIDSSQPTYIQTIRNVGYRFEPGD